MELELSNLLPRSHLLGVKLLEQVCFPVFTVISLASNIKIQFFSLLETHGQCEGDFLSRIPFSRPKSRFSLLNTLVKREVTQHFHRLLFIWRMRGIVRERVIGFRIHFSTSTFLSYL
jgi:hypothetical protein